MLLIYRIRIEELGQNLEDGADKTLSLRSLGLISKFQMMQERIRKGESIALLRKEARNTYAGSDSVLATRRDKLPWVYEMGLGIVNFVNFVAGGKTVTNRSKTRSEALMEEAYMLELQRNFDGAVKTYDKLAADPGSKGMVNFLRLHRAYCLAFSSSRRRAIEDLNFVVATNPVGEYRLTAEVLLAYLSDFDRKAEAIQALPPSAQKGAAYFNVGSYTDAINTLESLPGKQRNAEATYVLGRSYEEIGKSGKALENYRHLIRTKPGSRHALLANRRIFALGSIYASGQKLVDEAATVARTAIPDAELLREKKSTENLARAVAKKNTEIAAEIQVEKIAVAPVIPEEQPALAENITRATTALPAPVYASR
jgi:tetratricopeptide (TPR) repeat protein